MQNEDSAVLNLMRYLVAEGHEGVTGDERRSDDKVRSTAAMTLLRFSSEVGAHTG